MTPDVLPESLVELAGLDGLPWIDRIPEIDPSLVGDQGVLTPLSSYTVGRNTLQHRGTTAVGRA